jgi:hypothetical protein
MVSVFPPLNTSRNFLMTAVFFYRFLKLKNLSFITLKVDILRIDCVLKS